MITGCRFPRRDCAGAAEARQWARVLFEAVRAQTAARFAEHWRAGSCGGCVLGTLAPPDAILLFRDEVVKRLAPTPDG
jgi:hypothetical protein